MELYSAIFHIRFFAVKYMQNEHISHMHFAMVMIK